LRVRLPLEGSKRGVQRALHESLRFRRARIEFEQRLLKGGLRVFQKPLVTPLDGSGGGAVKLRSCTRHRFIEARLSPGLEFAVHRFERSEEHTSELQSHLNLVCRLLLEKKKIK